MTGFGCMNWLVLACRSWLVRRLRKAGNEICLSLKSWYDGCLFCRIGIILNGEGKNARQKSVRGILSSATAAGQYSCGMQVAESSRNRGWRCSSEICAAKCCGRRLIARNREGRNLNLISPQGDGNPSIFNSCTFFISKFKSNIPARGRKLL